MMAVGDVLNAYYLDNGTSVYVSWISGEDLSVGPGLAFVTDGIYSIGDDDYDEKKAQADAFIKASG